MKQSCLILIIIIFIGCDQRSKEAGDQNSVAGDRDYGQELVESGFLIYTDSARANSLEAEIIESFDIYSEDNYRFAHIDAEALSEFNFQFFMPQVNKILSKRDIKLEVMAADGIENSHEVLINGQKIKLYTNLELANGTYWDTSARNFFKKVNEIVTGHSIEEKFYLLYAGNDLHTFLLTEKQFKIISGRYANDKGEIPYLP